MPVGTIAEIHEGKLTLVLEVDGKEILSEFPTSKQVDTWIAGHPSKFHKETVIEYVVSKNGTIVKVLPPQGFHKAVSPELQKQNNAPAVSPPQGVQQPETIGLFDSKKVHGYEVSDTCQLVQFEPITIKVTADDPETARRALIEAWQVFGQHNELVRDTIRIHIERSLMSKST